MKVITTSWDDGNINDKRLAELMDKYKISGTFYIPKANQEHSVMSESDIIEISSRFEVGGHTMNHVRISNVSENLFVKEIKGCYTWLNDLIGTPPVTFCFPGGVFNPAAVKYCKDTGFKLVRTTELLTTNIYKDSVILPTTIQLYPHKNITYYKHLIKRKKWISLRDYFLMGSRSDMLKLVETYLKKVIEENGCFHLWGHSWEIEEFRLWGLVEEIFRTISGINECEYLENKDLLRFKAL